MDKCMCLPDNVVFEVSWIHKFISSLGGAPKGGRQRPAAGSICWAASGAWCGYRQVAGARAGDGATGGRLADSGVQPGGWVAGSGARDRNVLLLLTILQDRSYMSHTISFGISPSHPISWCESAFPTFSNVATTRHPKNLWTCIL